LPAEAALQSDIFSSESSKTLYSDYTLQDLEVLLKKVLEKEDYESAARIRETIKKKRNNP
jgi:protein-arginine kinase activator protein McsA